MLADHYLLVQRWRPNFDPWKTESKKKIAAWIRIPGLPIEFYNHDSLWRVGGMIGRTLKVDMTTTIASRGKFARLCVEMDLRKLLLPNFRALGRKYRIEYEGLHLLCFNCGKYGHHILMILSFLFAFSLKESLLLLAFSLFSLRLDRSFYDLRSIRCLPLHLLRLLFL